MTKDAPRPVSAKIGVHTYEIKWLSEDEWAIANLKPSALGTTYSYKQQIYMRLTTQCSESGLQEVLLHELTHAVWDATQMTHTDLNDIKDPEEFVIALQSPSLLGVFKDNPHVVKYLMSDGDVVR